MGRIFNFRRRRRIKGLGEFQRPASLARVRWPEDRLTLSGVARETGLPVYAVVPTSTIDLNLPDGDHIPIEERDASEVTHVGETLIAPVDVPVYNPAFDVTPHRYITGIVTEEGICYPPFEQSLRKAKEAAEARIRSTRAQRREGATPNAAVADSTVTDSTVTNSSV